MSWLVLLARLPNEPARHRMAVWRELRRAGAVLVGTSTWALPEAAVSERLLDRLRDLVDRADGALVTLRAQGRTEADSALLLTRYQEARREEWSDFAAGCERYRAELARQQQTGTFTLVRLEQEEQGLNRLRRWWQELRARDVLGSAEASAGERGLRGCEQALDTYARRVYARVGTAVDH